MDNAFVRADVNQGCKLEKKEAELMPAVAARFEQPDTNADGHVTRGVWQGGWLLTLNLSQ